MPWEPLHLHSISESIPRAGEWRFESEGAKEAEVSELLLAEVEISELLSEEELGEALGWRESAAVLEITGMAPE